MVEFQQEFPLGRIIHRIDMIQIQIRDQQDEENYLVIPVNPVKKNELL